MNAILKSPGPNEGHSAQERTTPTLIEPATTAQLVERAVSAWRANLAARAGASSLADITLLGDAVLDLSNAHPSGVAQLFAGRPTQLANLFREGGSLPAARRRARAVGIRAKEHAEQFGIAPNYLAIGIATWTEDSPSTLAGSDVAALARVAGGTGAALDADLAAPESSPEADEPGVRRRRTVRAPVLLRPIRVQARGSGESDYELTLEPSAELNPVLGRALRSRGALLDPVALALGTFANGGFDPRAATERIHALGAAVLADFELSERLIVGTFVHPGQLLVDDLDELSGLDHHEVIAALAALAYEEGHDQSVAPAHDVVVPVAEPPVSSSPDAGEEGRDEAVRDERGSDERDSRDRGASAPGAGAPGAAQGRPSARVAQSVPLPDPHRADRDPASERGVGDLDPAQQYLLDAVGAGAHLFVDAPAGADVPGTVAAVIADAAAHGRQVLYVPGHRRAAEGVIARMDELGVSELLLDIPPEATWRARVSRRLLGAMTLEAPEIDRPALGRLRADLLDTRRRLSGYIESLHLVRDPWGVSAYDALQGLARLTAERPAPSSRVRLDEATMVRVTSDVRDDLSDDVARAAELGAFTLRATSTPWYGAAITTESGAREALGLAKRLTGQLLPALGAQIAQVRAATGLVEPRSLREWGEQLQMLAGMRATLDVFQPMIFERTAADLVAATASKQWRADNHIEMGRLNRRRLRRQAKDMLRPGTRVPDLHTSLIEVQAQRQVWQDYCPGGGWPRLPEGLALAEVTYSQTLADVTALDVFLETTPAGANLEGVTLETLVDRTERLAGDPDALETLPDRTTLLANLRAQGLGELLDDLANRRVPTELVRAELDLAWWSSVFEQILRADRALAMYDGAGLEDLAARFRDLDRDHVNSLAGPILGESLGHLSRVMRNYPTATEALFAELLEGRFTSLRDSLERYPELVRALRPALVATPTLVPHILPATRTVDLVILDSVQHLPMASLISAIARGRQILVIGDARCASGDAVRTLSQVLPTVALQAQVSSRDQQFVDFLGHHGYEGVLRPTPVPQARHLIGFDTVHGTGMPEADSGTVMTTQAEVDRVVDLAITHALTHPHETLAIVAMSPTHADRVREALLSEVRHNAALASFFDPARPEAVVIADLAGVAGLTRDAVIISVGFGRTPHGRVLHRFGPLSEPGGDAKLLDALGVSRARLHVVSCFGYGDLDPERLRVPGARLLGDLLEFAERRADEPPASMHHEGIEAGLNPDRLVIDLAERLWSAGLLVETDFGFSGGDRIPLVVGHPDVPDRMLVAVLTDDDAYVAEPSVRVRDRQIAERLEALGWTVVQVWSAAAFLDPVKEANRVRQVVLTLAAELANDPLVVARALPIPHALEADDDALLTPPEDAHDAQDDGSCGEASSGDDAAFGDDAPSGEGDGALQDSPQDGSPDESLDERGNASTEAHGDSQSAAQPSAGSAAQPSHVDSAAPRRGSEGASNAQETLPGLGDSASAPRRKRSALPVRPVNQSVGAAPDSAQSSVPSSVAGLPSSTAPLDPSDSIAPGPLGAGPGVIEPTLFDVTPDVDAHGAVTDRKAHDGAFEGFDRASLSEAQVAAPRPTAAQPSSRRTVRPRVARGLPISAYGDNEIDALAAWIDSDGAERTHEQLAMIVRTELGIVRRSNRVDAVVNAAVARTLQK